jgi:hypothetical protein
MSAIDLSRRSMLLGAASALASRAVSGGTRFAVAQPAESVSCALVMAVDVSSSIDGEHWWLQRKGYAEAFRQPEVIRAITDTARRRIAVCYFEWAGVSSQRMIIPWSIVASADDGDAIAARLLEGRRPFEGVTAIGQALDTSMTHLAACPFVADQQVVDVSGDGGNNDGPAPEPMRAHAASRNIRVNGLPIDWAQSHPPAGISIGDYYRGSVIGGPNAFAMPAVGFDSFGYALAAKLRLEAA